MSDKNNDYIESVSGIIHKVCRSHFPTFSHQDLFIQGVVIALEQRDNYDPSKTKSQFTTWIYGQLHSRLNDYVKRNMLIIAVPNNITPDWGFGNIDTMYDEQLGIDAGNGESLHNNLFTHHEGAESLIKRRQREELEDRIIKKAENKLKNIKRTNSRELITLLRMMLRGATFMEVNEHLGKAKYWACDTLPKVIRHLEA